MTKNQLETLEIRKDYSGVPVLMGVSLSLQAGEVVGLVGHNGAGKSTLLKVLSGAHRYSSGALTINGERVEFSSPAEAITAGVSTVYQELSLLGNLTVTENVWLGRELRLPGGKLDRQKMKRGASKILEDFGLSDVDPDEKVGNYPVATRQLLEIAIASSRKTQFLLLDEPTTSLEGEQVTELLRYIKNLAKERQIGVLIVNHKLDELYEVADRIVALMNGRIVIDTPVETADRHDIVAAIAGEEHAELEESSHPRSSIHREVQVALEVNDLHNSTLCGVTFKAHQAEILGIYGLGGSGRSETLRAIAGIEPAKSGYIELDGRKFLPRTPSEAMRHGIAFLTEERKSDGIVPQMSSVLNAALPVVGTFMKGGVLRSRKMKEQTSQLLESLHLRGDASEPITSLSGGNQQKVLLAKALIQKPTVLLLDEPSKGVDIGAKAEIHQFLKRLAHDEGYAIVMVSSEEEEILDLSDRVVVFSEGSVIDGPLPVEDLTVSDLRRLAWGELRSPTAQK
ncbi:sugar ABC transporter ATP-binding protein [Schaalia sp. ZJ405]|uniref:sugar ABC transporter ATP-binding protein n=1 Tax=unclassified Schaalia TaxID=2691889 RepID=UPI0013EE02CF|nr:MULTISPECIES: sugar ABC transporter ATP-binding protein [unclassified Schaalia]QPK81746.1 sugar ABC transporter ATP-binding protein [Schaalia sp. ZJ405]